MDMSDAVCNKSMCCGGATLVPASRAVFAIASIQFKVSPGEHHQRPRNSSFQTQTETTVHYVTSDAIWTALIISPARKKKTQITPQSHK